MYTHTHTHTHTRPCTTRRTRTAARQQNRLAEEPNYTTLARRSQHFPKCQSTCPLVGTQPQHAIADAVLAHSFEREPFSCVWRELCSARLPALQPRPRCFPFRRGNPSCASLPPNTQPGWYMDAWCVANGVHFCSRVCRTLRGHPRVWQWLTVADMYITSVTPASGFGSWNLRSISTTQRPSKRISVCALCVDAVSHPGLKHRQHNISHHT